MFLELFSVVARVLAIKSALSFLVSPPSIEIVWEVREERDDIDKDETVNPLQKYCNDWFGLYKRIKLISTPLVTPLT